jgi:hypothetical protein
MTSSTSASSNTDAGADLFHPFDVVDGSAELAQARADEGHRGDKQDRAAGGAVEHESDAHKGECERKPGPAAVRVLRTDMRSPP